jgi:hypothetical protein
MSGKEKGKPGRPATGKGAQVQVRFHPDDMAIVDAYAAEHGISRPEAIRRLIRAGKIKSGKGG